ncbi:unnamed protein product [Heligmosomoides polygyrus]|uniref:Fork-head domain-containing protein n=1 Tax=Heligmosomoides polygyrus TaxID=6339 RepID=A0A3P8BHD6_HELPZ|nr:unnamed protein product [Heligmosomoides polygyrus]
MLSTRYATYFVMIKFGQIDYHATNMKPPLSYAQLIMDAMTERRVEKITLSEIYEYAARRYAYYRSSKGPWKNSIRHNLSCNQLFKRIPRKSGEKGKGSYWTINDCSNPTPSVRSRKTKTEVSDIEEPPVTKPTSRVNTAVLQYMDSIRSRQKPLDPQEISLFDEPGSAVWDDHLLLNYENSSPAGSSVQMDLSESSFSDIGLSSDEQGISSEYNWQSDFSSYDLGALPVVPFVGQFEEFHCDNIDIDPNTPPQWQDVDQYYNELIRLEGEEHL